MSDDNTTPDTPPADAAAAASAPAPAPTPAPDAPPASKPAAKARTVRRQASVPETLIVTGEVVTNTVITDETVDALPASATLAAPYAFYDDDNQLHSWAAGQVITDPDVLALLIDRGAVFEPAA